jgi:site-specific DNA-adenine methylase
MTYPGGKNGAGVYQQIINQIPPHRVYIEPFLGGGAVMMHKKPAIVNIGIDSDAAVVQHWRVFDQHTPPGVIINCDDAISFLKDYVWQGDEFVYCDPPYLFETRSGKGKIYTNEFGDIGQHIKLLTLLLSLPCPIAISGYWSSLYAEILATWRTISYQTRTRGGSVVREYLWMNYTRPLELHDYRYLGDNFRERERIKRIKTRWLARLDRMDDLERYALILTIADYSGGLRKMASKASPDLVVPAVV